MFCLMHLQSQIGGILGKGAQVNSPVQQGPNAGVSFRGTSYRLNGSQRRSPSEAETSTPMQQTDPNSGVSFRGKSYCLGGRQLIFVLCCQQQWLNQDASRLMPPSLSMACMGTTERIQNKCFYILSSTVSGVAVTLICKLIFKKICT